MLLSLSTNVCAASEYAVKSAIIYKITKFVQWPDSVADGDELKICVVGINPFGKALNAVNDKVSQGKTIKISYLENPNKDIDCHIAFLHPKAEQMKQWIQQHNEQGILTISDIKGFAKSGGMVELEMKGKRIGFLIHRKNASKAGFNFKSQLLRLAKIIKSQGD
ncbi:YfiR family protein [Pelagibaculum spongiae]|uniref:YfiR family protein n=1 Tax=Pelagibaculum spongiae TaxID=2080658 RepID=UPI0013144B29|nr:YfiR family protein [Pelagibaculum spongiae]